MVQRAKIVLIAVLAGVLLSGQVPRLGSSLGAFGTVTTGATEDVGCYIGTNTIGPCGSVGITGTIYKTATNCSSSASPAVCASAAAGSVTVAAAATTKVVNTTAVTANSQILILFDSSLGTKLGVTCNTTLVDEYGVTARTAGTSFTITVGTAPTTNPACFSYLVVN